MLGRNIYRFAVVLLFLWSTSTGIAQVRSGSIVGLVVDPSGAPVPDAAITVLAAETNIRFETRTNASGQYTVPYLAAGRYTVTVMREGFVAAKTSEIEVGTAQTARANVQLQLGSVSNTVEVNSTLQGLPIGDMDVQRQNMAHARSQVRRCLQPSRLARDAAADRQYGTALGRAAGGY